MQSSGWRTLNIIGHWFGLANKFTTSKPRTQRPGTFDAEICQTCWWPVLRSWSTGTIACTAGYLSRARDHHHGMPPPLCPACISQTCSTPKTLRSTSRTPIADCIRKIIKKKNFQCVREYIFVLDLGGAKSKGGKYRWDASPCMTSQTTRCPKCAYFVSGTIGGVFHCQYLKQLEMLLSWPEVVSKSQRGMMVGNAQGGHDSGSHHTTSCTVNTD